MSAGVCFCLAQVSHTRGYSWPFWRRCAVARTIEAERLVGAGVYEAWLAGAGSATLIADPPQG